MLQLLYSLTLSSYLLRRKQLIPTDHFYHLTPTIHWLLLLVFFSLFILIWFASRPQEEELVSSENSASIFNTLSDLPSQLRDGPAVLGEAMRLAGALSQETLEAHRHKHLAYILNEQTQLNNGNNATLNTNLNKVSRCSLWKVSLRVHSSYVFFFFFF